MRGLLLALVACLCACLAWQVSAGAADAGLAAARVGGGAPTGSSGLAHDHNRTTEALAPWSWQALFPQVRGIPTSRARRDLRWGRVPLAAGRPCTGTLPSPAPTLCLGISPALAALPPRQRSRHAPPRPLPPWSVPQHPAPSGTHPSCCPRLSASHPLPCAAPAQGLEHGKG